ncbi:DddA-like double-stranded DNA deaminase toxin [Amycolatopsis sp. NPDC047767]|uniref:DddA-like double-stranded DNA deaminase toxin n=1 Tax=Amycolatopsis sp. NPDC047767 TaxID=3156765 RepID=UPI003453D646
MVSVEQLVQGVNAVVGKLAVIRGLFVQASQAAEEAGNTLAQATEGTHADEVALALSLLGQSREGIATMHQLVGLASLRLESYVARVGDAEGGGGAAGGTTGGPLAPPAGKGQSEDPVEKLRRELPPPVTGGRGVKTHGRWFAPGKNTTAVTSGRDAWTDRVNKVLKEAGCQFVPLTAAADVELKIAAEMRDTGITDATVVINNEPCTGQASCDNLLGVVLPEGSTLTVHGAGGFKKVYKGGKRW